MTEKETDPTPWLGKPKRENQVFTYSENKLLDQITIELMQAWKDDLIIIRDHHREILDSEKTAARLSDIISMNFPMLEKFLNDNDFITSFGELKTNYDLLNFRVSEINATLFRLEEKLQFPKVKDLLASIEELKQLAKEIKKNSEKKPWWKKIL